MFEIFYKKKGFTLVEMLVVMGIVALLSTLAVNSYLQYRKAALIDLNTDELISQINELRSKAIFRNESTERIDQIKAELSGDVDDSLVNDVVDSSSKCHGVYFQKEGDEYKIYSFKQTFEKLKEFDALKGWDYRGCGAFDPDAGDIDLKEIILDEQVALVNVTNGDVPVDQLVLRFAPPKGKLEVVTGQEGALKIFNFTLQYGPVADPRFSKTASLDLVNFNFFKKNEEAD